MGSMTPQGRIGFGGRAHPLTLILLYGSGRTPPSGTYGLGLNRAAGCPSSFGIPRRYLDRGFHGRSRGAEKYRFYMALIFGLLTSTWQILISG